jgi:hypothetical protein
MAYSRTLLTALFVLMLVPSLARADLQGEWIETDTLGLPLYTGTCQSFAHCNYSEDDITNQQNLAYFIGAHYYFRDHVRIGMNLQLTERLNPTPGNGQDIRTFAFLPQIAWNFSNPFFVALTLTIAPWTSGGSNFDLGFQGVFGASTRLTDRIRGSLALEVPVYFYLERSIGITPLLGISIRI